VTFVLNSQTESDSDDDSNATPEIKRAKTTSAVSLTARSVHVL
jgi:hypothetical protein